MNTSWKYDNTFIKYRLDEADRSRFILPNPHLSNEEKNQIIEFFKIHNEAGKNIPWQSKKVLDWKYEDFEPYMRVKAKNLIKSNSRKLRRSNGLAGLKEGEDYVIIEDNDNYTAYLPLCHKASRIIASNMVEPKLWCESTQMGWSDKEILPKGEPVKGDLYPGAKWCISMENPRHWNETPPCTAYLMVCYKDPNRPEEHKKECVVYYEGEIDEDDSVDASDTPLEFDDSNKLFFKSLGEKVYKWVVESEKKGIEKFKQNNLNPNTGRYDKPKGLEIKIEFLLDKNGEVSIPLGKWDGDFKTPESVTSLKNFPTEVTGLYGVEYNPHITSLKGSPKKVGAFRIGGELIESLEGSPEHIKSYFYCLNGHSLKSFKGLGKVGGKIWVSSNDSLESLEGLPDYVEDISLSYLTKLKNFVGGPKEVAKRFECKYCWSLESLDGTPEKVEGNFHIEECPELKSLKGSPRHVGGYFIFNDCPELESLDGAPEYVGGDFVIKCKESIKDKTPNTEIGGRYINGW